MTKLRALALLIAVQAACGSAHHEPQTPDRHPPSHWAGYGSGSATPLATDDGAPTDAECDRLFEHAVALDTKARQADEQLAAAESTSVTARLRTDQVAECRQLSRGSYRCMIEATTTAALAACK